MNSISAKKGLWGHYEHNLDDKGRVILPLEFREALGSEFICTLGPGGHVRAYPMETWMALADQVIGADLADEYDPDSVLLQQLFGNCDRISPDAQFRITIPRHLRRHAELDEMSPAVIIGAGNRLEFWSSESWKTQTKKFSAMDVSAAASRRKNAAATALPQPAPIGETGGDSLPDAGKAAN